jgi:hypothetical protein
MNKGTLTAVGLSIAVESQPARDLVPMRAEGDVITGGDVSVSLGFLPREERRGS